MVLLNVNDYEKEADGNYIVWKTIKMSHDSNIVNYKTVKKVISRFHKEDLISKT